MAITGAQTTHTMDTTAEQAVIQLLTEMHAELAAGLAGITDGKREFPGEGSDVPATGSPHLCREPVTG